MSDRREARVPAPDEPRLYRARPRGIGADAGGCMVCGGDETALRHNCAFFVPSRETGEAIVSLFRTGARLDYRPYEPGWIQAKISTCDQHLPQLIGLVKAVTATEERRDGPGISAEMVQEFTSASPRKPQP